MEYILVLCLLSICFIIYAIVPTYFYKWKQLLPKKKRKDKVLFLTFDDGPDVAYTAKLLELLARHSVKASFFTVATFAEQQPDIIKRMKEEGHLIAYHSLAHKDAWFKGFRYTEKDFLKAKEIYEKLETEVHYFRPPWGRMNICTLSNIKSHGLRMVLWDVMAQDWKKNTTVDVIRDKLLRRVKNGRIICLHDGRGKNGSPMRMTQALEEVLPKWIEEGYRFATVEELYESKNVG